MNPRWKKAAVWMVLLMILIAPGTHILADDGEATVSPNQEEQGGITVESQTYASEQYLAYTHIADSINPFSFDQLPQAILGLTNMIFGMTKTIAGVVDAGINVLYDVNVVNAFADTVGDASDALWDVLYGNFGALLLVIAVLQIFFIYIGQKNGMQAGKYAFRLFLVLIVAGVWFTQSGWTLKAINGVSNEAQGAIMSAGTHLTTEELGAGDELEGSKAMLRNAYFDIAVKNPYLVMNYGTTDEDAITEEDSDRITTLLQTSNNEAGNEEAKNIVEEEAEENGNDYMSEATQYEKLGVSVVSLFLVFFIGAPLFLISMVNFLLQILMLVIALFLPISFLLAMIPAFANSGWYTLGRLLGVAGMKIFVGLLLLLTFLIVNIANEIIPSVGTYEYMLNALVIGTSLILLIKYRNKLVEFITAGRVSSVDMNSTSAMYNKMVRQPTQKAKQSFDERRQTATKAAGAAATGGTSAAAGAAAGASASGVTAIGDRQRARKGSIKDRSQQTANGPAQKPGASGGTASKSPSQPKEPKIYHWDEKAATGTGEGSSRFQRQKQDGSSSEAPSKKDAAGSRSSSSAAVVPFPSTDQQTASAKSKGKQKPVGDTKRMKDSRKNRQVQSELPADKRSQNRTKQAPSVRSPQQYQERTKQPAAQGSPRKSSERPASARQVQQRVPGQKPTPPLSAAERQSVREHMKMEEGKHITRWEANRQIAKGLNKPLAASSPAQRTPMNRPGNSRLQGQTDRLKNPQLSQAKVVSPSIERKTATAPSRMPSASDANRQRKQVNQATRSRLQGRNAPVHKRSFSSSKAAASSRSRQASTPKPIRQRTVSTSRRVHPTTRKTKPAASASTSRSRQRVESRITKRTKSTRKTDTRSRIQRRQRKS